MLKNKGCHWSEWKLGSTMVQKWRLSSSFFVCFVTSATNKFNISEGIGRIICVGELIRLSEGTKCNETQWMKVQWKFLNKGESVCNLFFQVKIFMQLNQCNERTSIQGVVQYRYFKTPIMKLDT